MKNVPVRETPLCIVCISVQAELVSVCVCVCVCVCVASGERHRAKQSLEKRLTIAQPPDVSRVHSSLAPWATFAPVWAPVAGCLHVCSFERLLHHKHLSLLISQILRLHLKRFRYPHYIHAHITQVVLAGTIPASLALSQQKQRIPNERCPFTDGVEEYATRSVLTCTSQ